MSATDIHSALSEHLLAGIELDKARAAHAALAEQRNLAAVMGYASRRHKAITKSLSDTQTRHEAINSSAHATEAVEAIQQAMRATSYPSDEEVSQLFADLRKAMSVLMRESEKAAGKQAESVPKSAVSDFNALDEQSRERIEAAACLKAGLPNISTTREAVQNAEEHAEVCNATLSSLIACFEATPSVCNKRKAAAIGEYDKAMGSIKSLVNKLAFNQKAEHAQQQKIDQLMVQHQNSDSPLDYFESPALESLNTTMDRIKKQGSAVKSQLQHISDATRFTNPGSSNAKVTLTNFKLPANINTMECGLQLIRMLEAFMKDRGSELWWVQPQIARMILDIDSKECIHWKPPDIFSNESEIIDQQEKPYAIEQSKILAAYIRGSPGYDKIKSRVESTNTFGVTAKEFRIDHDDGISMIWAMLNLYRPLTMKYRRELLTKIVRLTGQLKSNDIARTLTLINDVASECSGIGQVIDWHQYCSPILGTLNDREKTLAPIVQEYWNLRVDHENAAGTLDKLCTRVIGWLEGPGKTQTSNAKSSKRARQNDSDDGDDEDLQAKAVHHFTAKQMQQLVSSLQAKLGSRDERRGTGNGGSTTKNNICQVVDCSRKIEGWKETNNWKLCASCLLKCRKEGQQLTLKNGNTWGSAKKMYIVDTATRTMAQMVAANALPKAMKSKFETILDGYVQPDKVREAKGAWTPQDPKTPKRKREEAPAGKGKGGKGKAGRTAKSIRASSNDTAGSASAAKLLEELKKGMGSDGEPSNSDLDE